jgi:hypothetical protein
MTSETERTAKKGRPGRPSKPDALTPAERAKRYRDKKKATGPIEAKKSAMPGAMVELQLKYDQERMKVILLENQLLEAKRKAAAPPGPNPLARQVKALLTQIREQDKMISVYNAEIARLRDDIASRK